jgi:hypothetical protein
MGYDTSKLQYQLDLDLDEDIPVGELRLGDLEDPKQRRQALEDLEQKVNALVRKVDVTEG